MQTSPGGKYVSKTTVQGRDMHMYMYIVKWSHYGPAQWTFCIDNDSLQRWK